MSDISVAAPGGESIDDVATRVARARRRILVRARREDGARRQPRHADQAASWPPGSGVGDEVVHRVFLEAASLCTVTWSSDGRTSVRVVNDTAHLR